MDFTLLASAYFTAAQAVGIRMLTVFYDLTDYDLVELWWTELFNFFNVKAE